jgi:hypothetical protein
MGDEQDGRSRAPPEREQLVIEAVAGDLVKRAERLVHEEQLRLADQRPGDGDALALAAGKLVRQPVGQRGKVHQRHQLVAAVVDGARQAAEPHLQRQADVVAHAAPGEQRRILEDEADTAPRADPMRRLAEHTDRAGKRRDQIGDDPEQGRLAASGRAEDDEQRAGLDREIETGDHGDRLAAAGIADRQPLGADRVRRARGVLHPQAPGAASFGLSAAVISRILVVYTSSALGRPFGY